MKPKRPGQLYDPQWQDVPKHLTIGDVLQQLDNEIGLDTPVFVFGYSDVHRKETHVFWGGELKNPWCLYL